jgi:ABC-2 type transport system permease protein
VKSRKIWYLVRKDLMESLGNRMVVLPMIALPLILCVAMPAAMIILGLRSGVYIVSGSQLIERILPLYDIPARLAGAPERLLYVFLNYIIMPFFYIIPIMSSAVLAANSVAGEKERRSLETLLYSPISNRELVLGKLLSAFIPSIAISLGSFILYFAVSNGLFLAMRGTIVVDSPAWIPAMLLLAPAASLLGLGCSLIASIKAKSYVEAQQASALAILPCLLFIGAQIGGLVIVGPLGVVAAALVLFGLDYLLIAKAAPRFERERIIDCL